MKIKSISKIILASIISLCFSFTPLAAFADCTNICDQSCNVPKSVKEANGCNPTIEATGLQSEIIAILKGIILAMSVVAVIFIIIGGINYTISAGDPGKIKKAKDTILYALIGLIICALAFMIVNWVVAGLLADQ